MGVTPNKMTDKEIIESMEQKGKIYSGLTEESKKELKGIINSKTFCNLVRKHFGDLEFE